MCTMWIDGVNGVARHVAQNVDFVVAAAADPPALRAHARPRLGELAPPELRRQHVPARLRGRGRRRPAELDRVGLHARHRRLAPALLHEPPAVDDDIAERGIDLLAPAWHILDITPAGRGDWYAGLDY